MTATATATAPAPIPSTPMPALPATNMPMALAVWYDDRMFQRCKDIAEMVAYAEGFTPKHLIGKRHACFMVTVNALNWKLSPMAVAMSTYETPGGKIGYEGKLVQAILENSGKFEGAPVLEYIGDWTKVEGKFVEAQGSTGKKYMKAAYSPADEIGLALKITWQVRGEAKPRTHTAHLRRCHPRNSTLWATNPSLQIIYTGMRQFSNVAAPGILMGLSFDREDEGMPGDNAITVSEPASAPEPRRADFGAAGAKDWRDSPGPVVDVDHGGRGAPEDPEDAPAFTVISIDGEAIVETTAQAALETATRFVSEAAKRTGLKGIEGWAETNEALIVELDAAGHFEIVRQIGAVLSQLMDKFSAEEIVKPKAAAPDKKAAAPAEKIDPASGERPNKAFWIREKLFLSPNNKGGTPQWKWWTGEIHAAIAEAQTADELMRLQVDNEQNLNGLKEFDNARFLGLMDAFKERGAKLVEGGAS